MLSLVYAQRRAECTCVTSPPIIIILQPVSNTFHARDIFAPVAAYLAKEVDSQKFGEEVEEYVRFTAPKPKAVDGNRLRGVVLKVDRFGNLITNITPQDAPVLFKAGASGFKIVAGSREITEIRNAYAEGAPGEVIRNSRQHGFSGDRRQPRSGGAINRHRQRVESALSWVRLQPRAKARKSRAEVQLGLRFAPVKREIPSRFRSGRALRYAKNGSSQDDSRRVVVKRHHNHVA